MFDIWFVYLTGMGEQVPSGTLILSHPHLLGMENDWQQCQYSEILTLHDPVQRQLWNARSYLLKLNPYMSTLSRGCSGTQGDMDAWWYLLNWAFTCPPYLEAAQEHTYPPCPEAAPECKVILMKLDRGCLGTQGNTWWIEPLHVPLCPGNTRWYLILLFLDTLENTVWHWWLQAQQKEPGTIFTGSRTYAIIMTHTKQLTMYN